MRQLPNLIQLNALLGQRLFCVALLMMLMTLVLVARVYHLQISEGNSFVVQAEQNRLKFEPLPPERGLIVARGGELLAHNVVSKGLYVKPDMLRPEDLPALIQGLQQYVEISERNLERFQHSLAQRRRPNSALLLRSRLSQDELARFSVNAHKFPEAEIQTELLRHYPQRAHLGHVTGYVGAINSREARDINSTRYAATDKIGKDGVERSLEAYLHGFPGLQKIEVDGAGRIVQNLDIQRATRGQDVQLSIDVGLQTTAVQGFNGKKGVLVASDPQNGDILAIVSSPSYDPNLFIGGIDHRSYDRLNAQKALFNRLTLGSYPPASTIKPFFAVAALNEGVTNAETTIKDKGYFQFEGDDLIYRNWKHSGHGMVNLYRSIVVSSDTYFYHLGYSMGIDTMHTYLKKFGFGDRSSVELWGERTPSLPSRDWKRRKHDSFWYRGDTINASIGQGFMLSNPLQLAQATNNLVNRGRHVGLRLVKKIGAVEQRIRRDPSKDLVLHNEKYWDIVLRAMEGVMHDSEGTAKYSGANSYYRLLGKTGTAQVISLRHEEQGKVIDERYRDHALFIGAAPVDEPRIAVVVIVENGGSGGAQAAPIARALMDQWLLRPQPQQLSLAAD